jgi:hypothetical protein
VPLPLSGQLGLQRSDVLSVVGPKSALPQLATILGPVESGVAETDMATFAFGIALGALIGVLAIQCRREYRSALAWPAGCWRSESLVGLAQCDPTDLRALPGGRALDSSWSLA